MDYADLVFGTILTGYLFVSIVLMFRHANGYHGGYSQALKDMDRDYHDIGYLKTLRRLEREHNRK